MVPPVGLSVSGAMIPSSRLVSASLDKGQPLVPADPDSEVAVAIRALAASLLGRPRTQRLDSLGA